MDTLTEETREVVTRIETPTREFLVVGIAKVLDFVGNIGNLKMDKAKFVCEGELTNEVLVNNLNDGGFGGVDVVGGIVDVFQRVEVVETFEGDNPRINLDEECYKRIEVGIHVGDTKGVIIE